VTIDRYRRYVYVHRESSMLDSDELLYLELEEKAAEYEQEWWQVNDQVEEMCWIVPDLRMLLLACSGIVTTEDVYERDGVWHLRRHRAQESAAAKISPPRDDRQTPRSVYIFSGIPGAGKTSNLVPLVDKYREGHGTSQEDLVVLCADLVRGDLPEYASGLGSMVVHEEACHITYEGDHPRARNSTADAIIDGIGRPAHMSEYAQVWSRAGCTVHVLVADCEIEVALRRMKQRALATGRMVPGSVLEAAAVDVADVIAALKRNDWPVTSWIVVDTSRDGRIAVVDKTDDWAVDK